MSQTSKKFFIGLAALKKCPKCEVNWMPCYNMASCEDCAQKTDSCEYCGRKNDCCTCEVCSE